MSDPNEEDMAKLKRLGRYLVGSPRVIIRYKWQSNARQITAWTDTDYAGCLRTRKSISGGVAMIGCHCIKTWSSTQDIIALPSGEAEYYGLVRGASQAIGIRSMLYDMGVEADIEINTDASAAKGIASRKGVGRVRHIEVHQLWVQEKVSSGEIVINKVRGEDNIADILTKFVGRKDRSGNQKRRIREKRWKA